MSKRQDPRYNEQFFQPLYSGHNCVYACMRNLNFIPEVFQFFERIDNAKTIEVDLNTWIMRNTDSVTQMKPATKR